MPSGFRVSVTYNAQRGKKRQAGEDRHALANAKACWAQFFPLGILSKIRAPLWLLFPPSVCWLTQAIILTSGLHPNSLRHLMALILPLEASPPELCAAPYSYWALFGSLLLFSLFFFHASYIVFIRPTSMGNMESSINRRKVLLWSLIQHRLRIIFTVSIRPVSHSCSLYWCQGSWAVTRLQLMKLVLWKCTVSTREY